MILSKTSSSSNSIKETDPAISNSYTSQLGRRSAYEQLVFQQRSSFEGQCSITFFSVLTSYRIEIQQKIKTLKFPSLLTVNELGFIDLRNETNFFKVNDIIFTMQKNSTVNINPYVVSKLSNT